VLERNAFAIVEADFDCLVAEKGFDGCSAKTFMEFFKVLREEKF
jgi:hypothetical protein